MKTQQSFLSYLLYNIKLDGTVDGMPLQITAFWLVKNLVKTSSTLNPCLFLFVLMFYGPVNPMGSCRARSVYLATRLLGRLSPLSG